MTQWLRLHLTNDDRVDLCIDGMTEEEALELVITGSGPLMGDHPGGNFCVVPRPSILWAEVIEVPKEPDDEDE